MIHPIHSLPEVQRLETRAVRSTTACGPSGHMVWRRWGNGPPIVFLHGGSGSWTHWIKNIDALAASYTLWIADLPGCGDSDLPPGAVDADDIFETVVNGMAQLFNGTPVDLVGFSFGSMVSGFVAAHAPHLIKRLLLVAPPALGLRRASLGLKSLSVPMAAEQRELAIRHNLQRMMLHDPAAVDDLAVALHAANFSRDRLRKRRISRGLVMTELQTRWRCPVYVMCGREDPLAKIDLHLLPDALKHCDLREVLLVDHAGHWVQYEQPLVFLKAAEQFLGGS